MRLPTRKISVNTNDFFFSTKRNILPNISDTLINLLIYQALHPEHVKKTTLRFVITAFLARHNVTQHTPDQCQPVSTPESESASRYNPYLNQFTQNALLDIMQMDENHVDKFSFATGEHFKKTGERFIIGKIIKNASQIYSALSPSETKTDEALTQTLTDMLGADHLEILLKSDTKTGLRDKIRASIAPFAPQHHINMSPEKSRLPRKQAEKTALINLRETLSERFNIEATTWVDSALQEYASSPSTDTLIAPICLRGVSKTSSKRAKAKSSISKTDHEAAMLTLAVITLQRIFRKRQKLNKLTQFDTVLQKRIQQLADTWSTLSPKKQGLIRKGLQQRIDEEMKRYKPTTAAEAQQIRSSVHRYVIEEDALAIPWAQHTIIYPEDLYSTDKDSTNLEGMVATLWPSDSKTTRRFSLLHHTTQIGDIRPLFSPRPRDLPSPTCWQRATPSPEFTTCWSSERWFHWMLKGHSSVIQKTAEQTTTQTMKLGLQLALTQLTNKKDSHSSTHKARPQPQHHNATIIFGSLIKSPLQRSRPLSVHPDERLCWKRPVRPRQPAPSSNSSILMGLHNDTWKRPATRHNQPAASMSKINRSISMDLLHQPGRLSPFTTEVLFLSMARTLSESAARHEREILTNTSPKSISPAP